MIPLFSSFLVSSNPLSSDDFNLTTRNIVVKLKSSLDRGLLLTRKLMNKGFLVVKLK
jgi:hypothetical protein